MGSIIATLLFTGAFARSELAPACSIELPTRSVFGSGLFLGPKESDWVVTVDGAHVSRPFDFDKFASGQFFVDAENGASFPVFRLTGDELVREAPLRPSFAGQYFKIERMEGETIRVFESEIKFVGEYSLPWAPKKDGELTLVSPLPFSTAYWSSVYRKQVYVLEQNNRFEAALHVLDLDDGSWYEMKAFDGQFTGSIGMWMQFQSLDEFGVVETRVGMGGPCSSTEWVSFDSEGNSKAITTGPLNGDAAFDRKGNLLKTDFDSVFIFRAPAYKEELVVKFTEDLMLEALKNPLACNEAVAVMISGGHVLADRVCPGRAKTEETCGFENVKLKFAGAEKFAAARDIELDACECKAGCADIKAVHWTLKLKKGGPYGRCVCYRGESKKAVRRPGFVASHSVSE